MLSLAVSRSSGHSVARAALVPLAVLARLWVVALVLFASLLTSLQVQAAPEAKLHCASYTPFRGAQTPFDPTMIIPKAQIEEDLKQLQPVTDCIRTYAVNQGLDQAVPVAASLGMKVMLGIWIGRNPVDNEAQIKTAIELAKAHPETVKSIIVGNEVLLVGLPIQMQIIIKGAVIVTAAAFYVKRGR